MGDRSRTGVRPKTDERLYGFARFVVSLWFRFHYGLHCLGAERVPETGGILIVANHASFLDICVLACALRRRLTFVARENLVDIPILGFLIRHWGPILLRRGASDLTAVRDVVEALSSGKAVCVFPEGTRTRDGALQPLQRGALFVVERTRVPVVPVGIAGTYEILPRTRRVPRLWGTLAVSFGSPFDPFAPSSGGVEMNPLERVRAAIELERTRAYELWEAQGGQRARVPEPRGT